MDMLHVAKLMQSFWSKPVCQAGIGSFAANTVILLF